jgi:hypothetical protein
MVEKQTVLFVQTNVGFHWCHNYSVILLVETPFGAPTLIIMRHVKTKLKFNNPHENKKSNHQFCRL